MSRLDWRRRAEAPELMDRPDCSQKKLLRTLDKFRFINPLLTRYRHILTHEVLGHLRREPNREYRLTDLGAGGCDMARWLIRRCRRLRLRIKVRAVERDPRIQAYAQSANQGYPEIEMVAADALDPRAWGAPDVIFANHLLHHLPDRRCLDLLRRLDRFGVRRYLISDIVRSRTAAWAYALGVAPVSCGSFLLADGWRSIRRGFTRGELERLIGQARLQRRPVVKRLFPARFLIVGGEQAARTEGNLTGFGRADRPVSVPRSGTSSRAV